MAMESESTPAGVNEETQFKREIGVFGGVSIIGGIMIGSGIFYLGSIVLKRTGMSMGLALLCWVVGGIVSLLGGLCFAELGAARPKAGGMVVYLNEAYHPIVGFLNGFCSWLLSGAGSIAAVAIAIPTALSHFGELSEFTVKSIAILLVVSLTVYNYFGVKLGSILQNVSMVAKLIPILLIMTGALIYGKEVPSFSMVPDGGPISLGQTLSMIAFATVATLWAYEGWTNLNTVTEEMKNPRRNLPLAIIITLVGITFLYTLFNYSIYKMIPREEIVSMIESGNLYLGTEVAQRIFGGAGVTIVFVGMMISMFGCLNGMILAFPRAYYAMGLEGHFFKSYGTLHPKYKVPAVSLIGQCVISCILIMLRSLEQLTSLVVFISMLFNVMVVVAVIVYRRKYPHLDRPYRVWGYPYTVIICTVLFLALTLNTLLEDPYTALIGLVVPAIGVLFYIYFDRTNKASRSDNI